MFENSLVPGERCGNGVGRVIGRIDEVPTQSNHRQDDRQLDANNNCVEHCRFLGSLDQDECEKEKNQQCGQIDKSMHA